MSDQPTPNSDAIADNVEPLRYAVGDPLTRFDATFIAIRVLALYALMNSTVALGWALSQLYPPFQVFGAVRWSAGIIVTVIPSALNGSVGVFLWARARWIAARLLPDALPRDGGFAPATRDLQAVALSVVGALLILEGVPSLLRSLYMIYMPPQATFGPIGPYAGDIVKAIVEMLLGTWLFFGSKAVAAAWYRARYAGVRRRDGALPLVDERQ